MIINRVGPLSFAKISGIVYALLGLVGGLIFAMISTATGLMTREPGGSAPWMMGLGMGAIIAAPILYGTVGFLGGLLGAWLYNVVAGMVGGIEIDVQ